MRVTEHSDEGLRYNVPAHWPMDVRPPGSPGWERSAVVWLLGLLPPGYQQYELLRAKPVVLGHMVVKHLESELHGLRRGFSTARKDLAEQGLEPEVIGRAMALYEQEGQRVSEALKSALMVSDALRGVRWRPQ